ncbi:unnamed protein product [Ilex paraguariensis]|uniref:CLASP N-terminal domain-containing protein n=1 Tax=Ilex paraguariensis TaxID=185542 RepID=A0ABC8R739_9AQUA
MRGGRGICHLCDGVGILAIGGVSNIDSLFLLLNEGAAISIESFTDFWALAERDHLESANQNIKFNLDEVKACHLLSFLSKELLGDFEACAEMFIPVLFKLVVITVLVIAESADNCIKTMLRNCKVARALPRIADCAKNDRNAILRARFDQLQDLATECFQKLGLSVRGDCFHLLIPLFKGYVLFSSKDISVCPPSPPPLIHNTHTILFLKYTNLHIIFGTLIKVVVFSQIINDEDGGMHRRHNSPSIRERSSQIPFTPQASAPNVPDMELQQ